MNESNQINFPVFYVCQNFNRIHWNSVWISLYISILNIIRNLSSQNQFDERIRMKDVFSNILPWKSSLIWRNIFSTFQEIIFEIEVEKRFFSTLNGICLKNNSHCMSRFCDFSFTCVWFALCFFVVPFSGDISGQLLFSFIYSVSAQYIGFVFGGISFASGIRERETCLYRLCRDRVFSSRQAARPPIIIPFIIYIFRIFGRLFILSRLD